MEEYVKPCGCNLGYNCLCINFMFSTEKEYENEKIYTGVLPSGNEVNLKYYKENKWHNSDYFIVYDEKILKSTYNELKSIDPNKDIKIK